MLYLLCAIVALLIVCIYLTVTNVRLKQKLNEQSCCISDLMIDNDVLQDENSSFLRQLLETETALKTCRKTLESQICDVPAGVIPIIATGRLLTDAEMASSRQSEPLKVSTVTDDDYW